MLFLFFKVDLPTSNFLISESKGMKFFKNSFSLDGIRIYDFISLYVLVSFLSSLYVIKSLSEYKNRMNYESFSILFYVLSFSIGLIKISIVLIKIYFLSETYLIFFNKFIIMISLLASLFLFLASALPNKNLSLKEEFFIFVFVVFLVQQILMPSFDNYKIFYYLDADKNLFFILNVMSILTVINFYLFKKKFIFIVKIILLLLSYEFLFFTNNFYFYIFGLFFIFAFFYLEKIN